MKEEEISVDYKNIFEEIAHKITSLNVVRENRIMLSKRMATKDSFWNNMFFMLNIIAICFFIVSLYKGNEFLSMVSGVYSIYVILLQYTINLKSYGERHALAKRNEMLIESKILKMKKLLYCKTEENIAIEKYNSIMDEYLRELEFFPNHSDIDLTDENYKKIKKTNKTVSTKIWLKLKDNFFELINTLIFLLSVYLFIRFW